jgi:ferritin-like metal-binding protein YciE
MAKESKKLDDLFHDTLKDIYFAEKKILTALPKMAKAAHSEELRAAFEKHHGETEDQVERLEKVFDMIGKKAQGKTCDAIIGLVEEGQEVMKEYKGSPALDAGLLAGAQAVEHYEISRYGTLKTWANELGLGEAVGLLDATLQEEKNTDATLTKIAEHASGALGDQNATRAAAAVAWPHRPKAARRSSLRLAHRPSWEPQVVRALLLWALRSSLRWVHRPSSEPQLRAAPPRRVVHIHIRSWAPRRIPPRCSAPGSHILGRLQHTRRRARRRRTAHPRWQHALMRMLRGRAPVIGSSFDTSIRELSRSNSNYRRWSWRAQ